MIMKYKVLSVRQPYASLLVSGIKDVENRSRRTSYRGTVLIHASAKEHSIMRRLKYSVFSKRDKWLYDNIANTPDCDVMSAIIGSVDILDCVQNHPSEWAERGQWHWVCRNAKVFKHPIRNVKGKLGLWEWEGDI